VPDDVSLVGFDDLPASAFLTPPLTTVRQPLYEIGLYAAHALLQLLGHPARPVDPPGLELVVRETTRRL
jgi:LacI family transcriptional regulator